MRANFNRTGQDRKDMVAALFDITGIAPKYKGIYTQAYQIGSMEVTRDGAIEFGDIPAEEVRRIMKELMMLGIKPESMPEELSTPERDAAETPEEAVSDTAKSTIEGTALSVSMPRDCFTDEALANLKKIIESKGTLMKAAFQTDDLPILEEEDKVTFPWFTLSTDQDANAYNHFIAAICSMAKNQTRITAKEKAVDNEKYAFRCFLLRLGLIGKEYKEERKVLLRNLSGSSAFKSGAKGVQAS